MAPEVKRTLSNRPNLTERGLRPRRGGYPGGMSPLEELIGEVEVSITDVVDSLDQEETARLYAEVLDFEQRLEALNDTLAVLAKYS